MGLSRDYAGPSAITKANGNEHGLTRTTLAVASLGFGRDGFGNSTVDPVESEPGSPIGMEIYSVLGMI